MTADAAERDIMARLLGLSRESSLEAARSQLATLPEAPGGDVIDTADERLALFLRRLQRNGASAHLARDRAGVVAAVADFIAARQSQRRFVAGHDARLAALPWRDRGLLPRFGVAEAGDRIAVSYARSGVAESGSLVLWTDRDNPALNSLLCDAQIVIVDRDDLHATLEEFWQDPRLADTASRPRGIMLVSGPSSTADIEMKLVMGAHGPAAVHVVVVDRRAGGPTVAGGR